MPQNADADKRVLLVEDEPIVARMAQAVLRRAGYRVDCVGTGREAIARLEKDPYPVVVLDLALPDIDGRGVVLWLRHFEAEHGRPRATLVVASAGAGDSDRLSALDVDAVLQKPLSVSRFLEAVERRGPVDFDDLLHRASNDQTLARQVLADLLVVVERERLAIATACQTRNFRPIMTRSHRLRGALLAVGARSAARHAGHLEQLATQERDDELALAFAALETALDFATDAVEQYLHAA